jgi:O-antigen/teichoic acid export membrane protein
VLALTIPLSVVLNLATAATRGSKVMHYDAIVQIAGPIFRLLTWVVGLLLLKNVFDAAIYATLLQQLFPAILAVSFAYWIFRTYFGKGIRWSFKPLWVYSAPLILSTLMYNLAPRMDRLVLGVVSDSRAVGVYSAAAGLAIILSLVHSSIVKTFLPVIADAYNRVSVDRAKVLYVTVTRWDARLTFIGVVSAILIALEILGLLGDRYAEALLPFVILAISVYISTIPGPTGAFLQMTNRQRVDAANALVFFIVGPLIQLGLALWLGWIGVAFGVLVMTVIINIVQSAEIYHYYDFHVFQRDRLLFTVLSIVVVALCAVAGIKQDLPVRLALLGLVSGSFLAFIYLRRTANDILLFKMLTGGSPSEKGQE